MPRNQSRPDIKPFTASSSAPRTGFRPKSTSKSKSKRKLDPTQAYTYLPSLPKRHRTSEQTLSLSKEETALSAPPRRRKSERGGEGDGEEDDEMEERIRKVARMIAADEAGGVESDEGSLDSDAAWEEGGSDEERWGDVFRDKSKGEGRKGKAKGRAREVVRKPAKPFTVSLDEDDADLESKFPAGTSKIKPIASIEAGNSEADLDEVADMGDDGDLTFPDLDEESEATADFDDAAESEDEFAGHSGAGSDDEDDFEAEARAQKPRREGMLATFASPRDELDGGDEVDGEGGDAGEEDQEQGEQHEADVDDDGEEVDISLPSDLSDDEDDPDALADLDSFVEHLAFSDKKLKVGQGEAMPAVADSKKKRKVLPVVYGPRLDGVEALGLRSNQKLDLASLIGSNPSLASASALLPSKGEKKSSSILRSGVLSAPLPTIVQERLDREAAYEKTREEGEKWSTLMKRVKEAEHLSFPLQAQDRGGVKTGGDVIASFKPGNKLESAVDALLRQANLTEDGLTRQEDEALADQDLSLEEIAERRQQLRQQRELMFRAEVRAKRVSKIKSKTFRKLARKRAERAGGGDMTLEDLEKLDPEHADEEREKMERTRAKERATLRHGAKSRWARDVGGDGAELEDRRRAKEDMLDIKERLTRKILGRDDGDRSSASEDGDGDEDDEGTIKARAFDQLTGLDATEPREEGGKGLTGMAFMQKAREREVLKAKENEAGLRRDIEMFGEDDSGISEGEEREGSGELQMMRVGGNEGRMVFSRPLAAASKGFGGEPTPSEQPAPHRLERLSSPVIDELPATNPWLAAAPFAGPSRKRNVATGSNSRAADKATATVRKTVRIREVAVDDDAVEINVDGARPKARPARHQRAGDSSEEDADLLPVNGVKAFSQRDLVAEAFAGDNVVEDFEADKQRQVDADAPKTEDTSLAGWGSWGGKGSKKRKPNPKFFVKTAGVEPAQRKDFGKSNVIITERTERKAKQFLAKDLPYPYTSKQQFERSFDMPLGSEWNSRAVHQKETLPRVVKKAGAIIEPIRRLF